ncbi:putative dual-specificity phosphatase laforin [Neospora caninum Liverpool]|uniref:Dual-specificity phosphatase laforin, putative n=1 Tax=Neospora caninum (strain Liverpool) TaxID=572307 RepID=F0VEV9_NEOCL|nr:putative dual-specificity phosphatase laforin [Neospora caninum Liverpool]CBZ52253.1 putative dual-specificity phosphatase laforin [Neospora caninum Liverpool]CEL66221.1 TPA: dual-specificity phosphatase laforin, putative [Neospora caninum Liverpool]|eukprot:XP_003882285.1 putative dual-specificity phosphatase laforin [Neospora caninum Liverpool]
MRVRFSVIAFVPPNAQLGVVGSAPFLGEWKLDHCVPLMPYSAPHPQGLEPSLWFRDIDIEPVACSPSESNDVHSSLRSTSHTNADRRRCGQWQGRHCFGSPVSAPPCVEAYPGDCPFAVELLSTSQRVLSEYSRQNSLAAYPAVEQRSRTSFSCASSSSFSCTSTAAVAATKGVWDAAAYRVATRAPDVQAVLERHPLRHCTFEYKFVLWYPPNGETAVPYVPATAGEQEPATYAGDSEVLDKEEEGRESTRSWRKWLFPPSPSRCPSSPGPSESVVWEGFGPDSNRKFCFDPFDVVVDVNELGNLECLYICRIAHFRDPRAGGVGENDLTTRFYNAVKSECRMHYSTIFPRFFVGSCPRQLKHILHLKEELKVTCIVNLQTEQDLCNNYPDPIASSRSAEAVSHLYDGSGLRYVWLPTADMCDSARKIAVANAAFLLLGLVKSGHSVYIHCNAGVGRSVAAACAFLCFSVGLDLRKANFLICARRPVAYWDEKAMKYGISDYQAKFGHCRIVGEEAKDERQCT